MKTALKLKKPQCVPPLDENFRPAILANRMFQDEIKKSGKGVPLILALTRDEKSIHRFDTKVFPDDHPRAPENYFYVERIFKFLLWQVGGWKIHIGGSKLICNYLKKMYSSEGERSFDYHLIGEKIYENSLVFISCQPSAVPKEKSHEKPLGRHLKGNRVGFDLGASDLKISAVINGKAIFSKEIEWEPKTKRSIQYHQERIMAALRDAASKIPQLDAIGGSSAGVHINNRPMVASLYRGIPEEHSQEVKKLFFRIRDEMGVPLEVVNDGEVAALAGSMAYNKNGLLGISLGSSEAAGYITLNGNITDWLNELAFAPVDYNPDALVDEWSEDRGCGVQYLSQQCVFRLAPLAGITIPPNLTDAKKLGFVREKLETGDEDAWKIWKSMGYYMGYALAHYADFYNFKHVLILGRCTSGIGGQILLDHAKQVLELEFPEIAIGISIQLPDEKFRRVGQAIAAASLPPIA